MYNWNHTAMIKRTG